MKPQINLALKIFITFVVAAMIFRPKPNDSGVGFLLVLASIALVCYLHFAKRNKNNKLIASQAAELEERKEYLLALPLTPISPAKALLKKGETAFAACTAALIEEKSDGFKAGTAGVSVRVAKGVTLRSGGIRGGAVKKIMAVANGELVISDKRLIFAGDLKSFTISLESLVSFEAVSDGFYFHSGSTTRMVLVDDAAQHLLFEITLRKVLQM